MKRIAPLMDEKIERLLEERPEPTEPDGSYMLRRFTMIALKDFIGFAFDRPDLGYRPPDIGD